MPKGLTRRAREKFIAAQLDALLVGQSELARQLTSFQETILMTLNKNEQAIVDALNASTSKIGASVGNVGDAVTTASQAIKDLFNNQASITLADVQPHLDALDGAGTSLDSAATALKSLATTDDPALTPTAPPITITTVDGGTTSVSPPTQPGETNIAP